MAFASVPQYQNSKFDKANSKPFSNAGRECPSCSSCKYIDYIGSEFAIVKVFA